MDALACIGRDQRQPPGRRNGRRTAKETAPGTCDEAPLDWLVRLFGCSAGTHGGRAAEDGKKPECAAPPYPAAVRHSAGWICIPSLIMLWSSASRVRPTPALQLASNHANTSPSLKSIPFPDTTYTALTVNTSQHASRAKRLSLAVFLQSHNSDQRSRISVRE